jgi:hypothetical protein
MSIPRSMMRGAGKEQPLAPEHRDKQGASLSQQNNLGKARDSL